jgi:uncharacterized protein YndB with AHSA1/START domain
MSTGDPTPSTASHDLVITRVIDASVERVWRAWTDPEQVMRWWGPTGFTAPVAAMEVREGGTSLVAMRSPEGQDLYNTWTYRKVVPRQRLEFVQRFADQAGHQLDPADLGLPAELPREVPHTVTFKAVGDGATELTVTEDGYPSQQLVDLSRAGMEQVLDKLADSLK